MKLKQNRLIAIGVLLIFLISVGFLIFNGLNDFDLSEHRQQEIMFKTDDAALSGTLILPTGNESAPIVLFIHGDGPQDRFSGGGYLPLMNALLDRGIGVYAWDKAGIGDSSGDWLQQSMADRAVEAIAAMEAVLSATAVTGNKVGFLGFSQAGWVLPKVAAQVSQDTYFVIIGGATNWQMQGAYFSTIRLKAQGHTDDYIRAYVQKQIEQDEKIFAAPASYDHYLKLTTEEHPMDEARFHFVAQNYFADSTEELPQILAPTLAIFGESDLNVDAQREAQIYEQGLANGHPENEVVVWPEATHGLAKTRWFNYQLPSQIPWYSNLYAIVAGRNIFAPGVIDHIASWVLRINR
jgi:pimeloyl-ACP methyl ester carboxylesterase